MQELQDEDYGARGYLARHRKGNYWYFGNYQPGAHPACELNTGAVAQKRSISMANEVRPVTEGSSSEIKEVFPYLRVRNAAAAIEFIREYSARGSYSG